ncbi:hypothetical protein Tco_0663932 [Tanacetum coccineum]
MDYTTSLLYDDVDVRRNDPVHTDEGLVQQEGTEAEMTNIKQRNEYQVINDAHGIITTDAKKTEVPMRKLFPQWMFLSFMRYQTLKLPHSLPSFIPPPQLSTPTPPPTNEATNHQSTLSDFAFVLIPNLDQFLRLSKVKLPWINPK